MVNNRIEELDRIKADFYNTYRNHGTKCTCGMENCTCGCKEKENPSTPGATDKPTPQRDPTPGNGSPIIVDLDRDGVIETIGGEDGVHFDLDGNRFAEKSGLVGSDDALLMRDLNGNGQVDNGAELFGNNSVLANGSKAANGFVALAELDTNRDGIVDKRDGVVWDQLRLWQDKNGNGILDAGELLTLEEAGISGLEVGYKNQSYTDENGNEHRQTGNYIREDGSKGAMTDVWFKTDLVDTQFMDEIEISDEIAGLPNLRGYGNMPSLHQAMALDKSGRLQALLAADPTAAKEMTWDIIFAWTGVTDLDPKSRGTNITDARKLYALEVIWGEKFPSAYGNNPGRNEGTSLQAAFTDWESKISSYFLLSTHYNGLYKLAAQAAEALEGGTTEAEAVKDLVAALREMYGDGTDGKHMKVLDFLLALKAYDSRGIMSSLALQSVYDDGLIADSFEELLTWAFKTLVDGSKNNDSLRADTDDTLILGRGGDDSLSGSSGADVLDGGAGSDRLHGGAGNDVFVYGKNYGHDTIEGNDGDTAKRDILRLVGLNRSDVEFSTVLAKDSYYYDVIITILETGETLTIQNAVYCFTDRFNYYGVQAIEFADGSVLEWADLVKGVFTMSGTEGNDNISASRLNTFIDGQGGDDYLTGGSGDNTYLFFRNDGQDTITNSGGGNDTLSFQDINPAELWFGKSGNHLTIGLIGSSDKVTVNNWFTASDYKIDSIVADDFAIAESQVALMIQAMAAVGAPGGVDGQWTEEQREALAPVLASYWQPRA